MDLNMVEYRITRIEFMGKHDGNQETKGSRSTVILDIPLGGKLLMFDRHSS
jgi:hypothetical protein